MAVKVDPLNEKESALRVRIGSAVIEVNASFNPTLFSEVVRTCKCYAKSDTCGSGIFSLR
jgi:hypothetical protein